MRLSEHKILTFDVYGTLIDWETGIVDGLRPLTDRVARELSRDEILEAHAFHESTAQKQTPQKRYPDLLASVHKRLAEEWEVESDWDAALAYGASVETWPAFPDSADALAYLKRHFRLAVLTNVDNRSFQASAAKLGVAFDASFTAEDVGSYKPAPRNFEYMLSMLKRRGIAKSEILHVAESLFHDHAPAGVFGIHNCHIYRRHGLEGFGAAMDPGKAPKVLFRYTSMEEFAAAHRAERGALH